MPKLIWDAVGERLYETGVDHGVLFVAKDTPAEVAPGVARTGADDYDVGVAWNGLTGVTESREGAEANAQYADNIKYLNLLSNEEFNGTIEAFTYPDAWEACDGSASPSPGFILGQQKRKAFCFAYRTRVGNDTDESEHGYKIHIVYNAKAQPAERSYETINDSPEPMTFSWEFSTTPLEVGKIGDKTYRPVAHIELDSTKVTATKLEAIEAKLFGGEGASDNPVVLYPSEIYALLQ